MNIGGGKLGGMLGGGDEEGNDLSKQYEEKQAAQRSIAADYGSEGFPEMNRSEQPRTMESMGMGRAQRLAGTRSLNR